MKKEQKTYIIGHKNPDTDSICSAIAYADIKNKTCKGKFIPKRAGALNEETAFVLNYFHLPVPAYLPDVRAQVKDMDFRDIPGAEENLSIKQAWKHMQKYNAGTLPIINKDGILEGLITYGDIAKFYMDAYDNTILSKAKPLYKDIADTLDGKIVVGDENRHFENGKVWSGASQPDIMESLISKNDLVIVGNRTDAQLCALDANISCMIVCTNARVSDSICTLAASKNVVIISTPFDAFTVARLINQSIPVKFFMKKEQLVTFRKDDYIEHAREVMTKYRFREFPVINSKGKYLGTISRNHLLNTRKKQLILVDHNEKIQAVDNIEEAEIIEMIDHHRIGSLETFQPVLFRNQPVGSTATILYQIYEEKNLDISPEIAGCLCAAILSDTLHFRSPTCTQTDIVIAHKLAKISNIQIDDFATKMFQAGNNFSKKTPEDIFYQDYKKFVVEDISFGIGQISFMSKESLAAVKTILLPYIEKEYSRTGVQMAFFMLTSILEESTELLCYGKGSGQLIQNAYGISLENHCAHLENVVSRKKQLLPKLMYALQT